MDSRTLKGWLIKRPNEGAKDERSRKRPCPGAEKHDSQLVEEKFFKFQVLLPNGTSVDLKIRRTSAQMPLREFVDLLKLEHPELTEPSNKKRRIEWTNEDLHFVDAYENKIRSELDFSKFKPNTCHILRLQDGSVEADTYENMWDLTPDTDLLRELPEEYTFETALADLIDNSLQAVWSNNRGERKFISVKISEDGIEIFDTGPGMDGSPENSIVKWGKMGASLHRLAREKGIGTKPPYLMPFFGMFGFGGPIATMHLGRRALVSSKTKQSKKVYQLHLEREALLGSNSERTWRANGGLRDPKMGETVEAPHGSFTKVHILEPRLGGVNIKLLHSRLKDIYFPYIQCDELSGTGKTLKPIEFQVNGMDLAEVLSGEVAVTNVHSCNGPEFIVQLHFTKETGQNTSSSACRASQEANARLRCVYFPIIKGKESIEGILEKLKEDGCGITEDFKSFSRVSVRRLGRLLPDARWAWLPFMEPKPKKGEKAQILKRCCYRVKCFIDTDGGFNPTPSKADLAHQNPYTIALRSFGKKHLNKEKDIRVEITKDGRDVGLLELERLYEDWISEMHDHYDEEMVTGRDEPMFVVGPSNKKDLGISSEVIRVHKVFWRKEALWRSGQKIKILKGAYAGFHKTDTYATLEYIILEGLQGDAGCEARLICRPIDVPDESGCVITEDKGSTSIRLGRSISLPISIIDSEKCIAIEDVVWEKQIQKRNLKMPSSIEILGANACHELGIGGAFPHDVIDAGCEPSEEIVAVIRPASFNCSTPSKNLDGKQILQEKLQMIIEIKFSAENTSMKYVNVFTGGMTPSSQEGVNGFYIFKLRKECPKLFEKAGVYTFLFSLKEFENVNCEKRVRVRALSKVEKWGLIGDKQIAKFTVRVGSCFPPLSIACFDKYKNRLQFPSNLKVMMKLSSNKGFTACLSNVKEVISSDKLMVTIKVVSSDLDKIRPSYQVMLFILPPDELFSVTIPFRVFPGVPRRVLLDYAKFVEQLVPGEIIKDLVLEANQSGCVDLGGLLKVARGFGKSVSFSVISDDQIIFEEVFQTERRQLRAAFEMPISITAGNQLENLVFEVVKTDGEVDRGIHGEGKNVRHHSLRISSDSLDLDDSHIYSFNFGRCTIQEVPLPQREGKFYFKATHSHHPELTLNVEVHILKHLHMEHEHCLSQISEGKILSRSYYENQHQFADKGLLLLSNSAVPSVVGALRKCVTNDPRQYEMTHENVLSHSSVGNNFLCKDASELEHYFDGPCKSAEKSIFLLPDSSAPSHVGNPTKSIATEHLLEDESFEHLSLPELEDELLQCGLCIKQLEMNIDSVTLKQSKIEQDIANLQDCLDLDYSHDFYCMSEKELVIKRIILKIDSAAAVICQVFQSSTFEEIEWEFANNILGVVASLGSVPTDSLSRILAQFLGEHQMLGIVCKSYAEASHFEKHGSDGSVNNACGLHALAAKLGMSIHKPYHVFCLENIRPYTGKVSSDSQRKLLLPDPILPNGKPPPGFLGYAVNMVDLDVKFRLWKMASGHGLRETLFYRLFGELQVYENRQYMSGASSCIKDSAVSLDGGILRGNGVLSLGYCDVDVQFPVVAVESKMKMQLSPRVVETREQIDGKKEELRETNDELVRERRTHENVMKKFWIMEDRYRSKLDDIERSAGGHDRKARPITQ